MAAEEKGNPIDGTGLIAAKCPSCGAILSVNKGDTLHCEFCGGTSFLHDSYKGKSREIRNYYDLAYAAQEIHDNGNAYKYYTKILELDSTEALAWYGKGIAALGYPEARKINTDEVISLFRRALANVDGEENNQFRETLQESCWFYASSFSERLWNESALNPTKLRAALALFDFADETLPLDNERLKHLIEILYTYSVLPWLERKEKIDHYTERIRATEPAYVNPLEEWEARKSSAQPPVGVNWRGIAVPSLIGVLIFLVLSLIFFVIVYLSGTSSV